MAEEEHKGGSKKTLEYAGIGLGVLLVVFLISQATAGSSSAPATQPTTTTQAPDDAATTAAASEYSSQLAYSQQVLANSSALQAAVINAIPAIQTNEVNQALGSQTIAAQEAENYDNNRTTVATTNIAAGVTEQANKLGAEVNEDTINAQVKAQEAQLSEELGIFQAQSATQLGISNNATSAQEAISGNAASVAKNGQTDQLIGSGITGLFGLFG